MPRKMKNPAVIADHVAKVHGCELSPFLACCGGHGETQIHHVLHGNANRIDAPWNLVSVCRQAHDWCHRNTAEGMVACWQALDGRGALDLDAIKEFWRRCPWDRIRQVADSKSDLRLIAKQLLKVHP